MTPYVKDQFVRILQDLSYQIRQVEGRISRQEGAAATDAGAISLVLEKVLNLGTLSSSRFRELILFVTPPA